MVWSVDGEGIVRKPRVLIASSDNNVLHGAFRAEVELAHELGKLGVSRDVLLPYANKEGEKHLAEHDVPYKVIHSFNWISSVEKENSLLYRAKKGIEFVYNDLVALGKIRVHLREGRYDLVHINTLHSYIVAKAAYQLGIPVIWHFRELLETNQQGRIMLSNKGRGFIDSAYCGIAISNAVKDYYTNIYSCPIDTIYDGVDPSGFYKKRDDILMGESVRMIMVGSIYKQKGQLELVKALALLVDWGITNFSLNIVGAPDSNPESQAYYEQIRSYVSEHGLSPYVQFRGPLDTVYSELHASDIAFMCSQSDAFGRVTVEAMMAGCVVIGAESSATPELIRNGSTGYLYEPGSCEALAYCIKGVLDNRTHARDVAYAGQSHAMEHYTSEANATAIAALYERAIKGSC